MIKITGYIPELFRDIPYEVSDCIDYKTLINAPIKCNNKIVGFIKDVDEYLNTYVGYIEDPSLNISYNDTYGSYSAQSIEI